MTAPYPYSSWSSGYPGTAQRYKPGPVALVLVVAGAAAGVIGFFALPWVSKNGVNVKFSKLRDLYQANPEVHGLAPVYAKWLGFVALAVVVALTLLAAFGLGAPGPSNTLKVFGATAAAGAGILHLVAVNKIFHPHLSDAAAGPWMILVGYGLMLAGAAVGARPDRWYGPQSYGGYHGYGGYPGY